jgi:ClpX C4-type zinc finger
MDRFCSLRPSLERQKRWPAEWEQRSPAEFVRQALDQPPTPAVERIGEAVARLRRRGERIPALAADHAGEHDCAHVGEFADPLALVELARPARNEAGSLDGRKRSLDQFGALRHRGIAGFVRSYLTVRINLTNGAMTKLHCSFCGKSEDQIQKLAAGPSGIFICNECVGVCQAIMTGEGAGVSRAFDPRTWPKERLLALLRPVGATADAYREHLQTIVDTLRTQDASWAEIANGLGVSRQTAWERFS